MINNKYWIAAGAAIVMTLAGCTSKEPAKPVVMAVYVTEAQAASGNEVRNFAGTIQPRTESELGFRVGGLLQSRNVEVGSRVRAGAVLASMEAADYNHALEIAKQNLLAAEADAKQNLQDAQRLEKLAAEDAVAKADAQRQRTRSDTVQARLIQAKKQLEIEENRTAYTQLTAPFDGVVTAIRAEVGQVVAQGMPIVSLARTDALEVVADVPEQMVDGIKQWSATAQLSGSLETSDGNTVNLKLREVAAAANPNARMYRVRYSMMKPPASWMLGRSVTLTLQKGAGLSAQQETVVELPVSATVNNGQSTQVWVVDGETGKLSAQTVAIKKQTQQTVWVTGVAIGAKVVSAGAQKLDAGMTVRPILRTADTAEAGAKL
jgi:RND family efflux transporter MFP subunit